MKKLQFLLLVLLLMVIHSSRLLGQCYNCEQLYINDPRSWWYHRQAAIEDVTMEVRPAGKFYEVDLYMTYRANPYEYTSEYDTLEVVHFFRLPSHASITDSWLWIGDTIMKADILERSTAFNIYEGIVNRRKDPSVLYKNQEDAYEFRIFPLPGQKSRKVKLTFLIASDENEAFELPLSMFALSFPRPDVKVIAYKKDSPLKPNIGNGITFETHLAGQNNEYAEALIPATKYSNNGGSVKAHLFKLEQAIEPISLKTAKATNSQSFGYYQICLDPAQLLGIDTLEKKKVVFVVDHQTANTYYSKQDVLASLKEHIKKMLNPKDEFRIIYNNLTLKEVSSEWLKYSSVDLDQVMAGISLGNNSLLVSSLYTAYEYVKNENDGILVVLSSDASVLQAPDAQALKDDLRANVGTLRPTYVLDYANYNRHYRAIYYTDRYYYGNELFYKILSSNTKGAYYSLEQFNGNVLLSDGLKELQNSLAENKFDYVNYFLRPKDGICYDDYNVNSGSRIIKTGRFLGKSPFNLEVVALYHDSLITANYVLDVENDEALSPIYRQCHAMSKILALESGQVSEADKTDVIEISLDNRVLSLYTAFLALEPGVEPCFSCVDDDGVLINTQDENDGIALTSSPNPFQREVVILLKGVESSKEIQQFVMTDLSGKAISIAPEWEQVEGGLSATLDSENLMSGVYLLKVVVKDKVYTQKLVKI
jgi:hypothetical protein